MTDGLYSGSSTLARDVLGERMVRRLVRAMKPKGLTEDAVAGHLADHHRGRVAELEPLSGGFWSSAWAYRVGDERFVARFGSNLGWYAADRRAMAVSRPELPVPEVREIGLNADGLAFAISVRHDGIFLEDTPSELAGEVRSTLARLLRALRLTDFPAASPVSWLDPDDSWPTWRSWLLAGLVDDATGPLAGWGQTLAADPALAPLAEATKRRIHALIDACPERRDLVHGDLLHGNVLLSPEADRVEAVFSWKCSVLGDHLFDLAWCSFWAPWHPGILAADPATAVTVPPDERDADIRHHCYELQIGFTHLGWNIGIGNDAELANTARRLEEILERGPERRLLS